MHGRNANFKREFFKTNRMAHHASSDVYFVCLFLCIMKPKKIRNDTLVTSQQIKNENPEFLK